MSREFEMMVDSCCDLFPKLFDCEGVHLVRSPHLLGREERLDDLWAESDMRRLEEMVRESGSDPLFVGQLVGPVIGSHVGPGMASLAYRVSERRS